MRTKSLLAAAALIAAGVLSSEAQNVYSLNVVGYINITLKPGFNLLTDQLKDTANPTYPINVVLTNITGLLDNSTFFKWDGGLQKFTEAASWVSPASGGPAWYNAAGTDLAADTAPRGSAFFIKNDGGDAVLTLVGEVLNNNTEAVTVPLNYSYLGNPVPAVTEIRNDGFPIADNNTVQTYNATSQSYSPTAVGVGLSSGGPAWYNEAGTAEVLFTVPVGQGFLHSTYPGNPSGVWNRNFTVQ